MKVVIDTNALMIPGQFGVDIVSEIERLLPTAELVVIESTMRELKNISDKKSASLALRLIEKNNITVEKEPGETDYAVITYAQSHNGVVFTNDKEMKRKCVQMRIPVMFLKKKRTIALEGLE
ncbi:hypothetical protein H0N95_00755 [Candidatus Micrarchaeota archaeon]|nr:hypothetical protein [Candidatus Micrarchaeota archaeon]